LIRWGYTKEKAEKLRDRRMAEGNAEWDVDFPKDPEEIIFWYRARKKATELNRTTESMEATGSMKIEGEMAESLLGAGGALHNGIRASVPGLEESKQLSFAEDLSNALTNDTCDTCSLVLRVLGSFF
jgi:hypothetical protein